MIDRDFKKFFSTYASTLSCTKHVTSGEIENSFILPSLNKQQLLVQYYPWMMWRQRRSAVNVYHDKGERTHNFRAQTLWCRLTTEDVCGAFASGLRKYYMCAEKWQFQAAHKWMRSWLLFAAKIKSTMKIWKMTSKRWAQWWVAEVIGECKTSRWREWRAG